jgi:hypothetical protein
VIMTPPSAAHCCPSIFGLSSSHSSCTLTLRTRTRTASEALQGWAYQQCTGVDWGLPLDGSRMTRGGVQGVKSLQLHAASCTVGRWEINACYCLDGARLMCGCFPMHDIHVPRHTQRCRYRHYHIWTSRHLGYWCIVDTTVHVPWPGYCLPSLCGSAGL